MRRVLLLDSASMYFRAFYGVPDTVRSPTGLPVNAVRGFLDMVSTLLLKYRPTDVIACLDNDWRPAFRVALVPSYKAHRVAYPTPAGTADVESVPDDLSPQVPILLAVLKAAGIAAIGVDGFEADDVIASYAKRYDESADGADGLGRIDAVDVVSGDRDLIALVTDRVRLLYIGRGLAKLAELTPDEVLAKYGIRPEHYADFAVLRGDPSDGLPGVAGIGEKTATSVVNSLGTIEQILAAAQSSADMSPSVRVKVLAAADYLAVAPAVVRPRTDVDIPILKTTLLTEPADSEMLDALGTEFGLDSPIARLRTAIGVVTAAS